MNSNPQSPIIQLTPDTSAPPHEGAPAGDNPHASRSLVTGGRIPDVLLGFYFDG